MSNQSELIETLVEFMRVYEDPIHYKILTDTIIEAGIWTPYGAKPDQIVYSAMHQNVKQYGEWSAFRFMGKGIFVFADVQGINDIELPVIRNATPKVKDAAYRAGDLKIDTDKRRAAMQENAVCGNCANLTFTGVEEYRRSRGECGRWDISGKCSTRVINMPCSAWQMRTIEQRNTDSNRTLILHAFLVKAGVGPSSRGKDIK